MILQISISKVAGITGMSYPIWLFFFETVSQYAAHSGLELTVLLPQTPKCWDYRCEPTHLSNTDTFALIFFTINTLV
jgi:hypothetical protein